MWFTIALQQINNIPAGTLLLITRVSENQIKVVSVSDPKERVIMHQPALWLRNIGFHPDLYSEKRATICEREIIWNRRRRRYSANEKTVDR